jgi:hypothetical protein
MEVPMPKNCYNAIGFMNRDPRATTVAVYIPEMSRVVVMDVATRSQVLSFAVPQRTQVMRISRHQFYKSTFVWAFNDSVLVYDLANLVNATSPAATIPEAGAAEVVPTQMILKLPHPAKQAYQMLTDDVDVLAITISDTSYWPSQENLPDTALCLLNIASSSVRAVSTSLVSVFPQLLKTPSNLSTVRLTMDAQLVYVAGFGSVAVYSRVNLALLNVFTVGTVSPEVIHSYRTGCVAVGSRRQLFLMEFHSRWLHAPTITGVLAPVGLPAQEFQFTEATWSVVAASLLRCTESDLEVCAFVNTNTPGVRFVCAACHLAPLGTSHLLNMNYLVPFITVGL